MARRRTPSAARPQRRDERASKRSRQPSSWVVVLGLVGVFAGFFLARRLTAAVAPVFYGWADADHHRLAVLLLAVYATGPPLLVGALALHRRRGPLAAAPLWLPVGLVLLVAVGSFPGRSDNGELSRALTRAAGGSPITASGDVFIAAGVAALPCFFLVSPFLVTWVFAQGIPSRVAPVRAIAGALIYVVTWVAAGTVVLATVDDTDARITWLETSAEVLAGGDDGVTGDFQVGLDASVLDVVDCDTAADRLRVDGREPELDGCRRALLVVATGRYDRDGVRTSSGELAAVVVQVGDEDELESLDTTLDGVEILAGDGLPEPVGDVMTTPATAALALVIAAEDTGDIPLPAEGAGRRPLSRSLAYVAIGTAVGLYVSPPEETPASP